LTAVYEAPVGVRNIVTLNMDGSNVRVVGPAAQGAFPTHSRTGGLIAYNQQMTGGMGIKLVDSSGSARVLVDPSTSWWSGSYPVFSRDGASIYFGANTYNAAGIWRMNLDGTGVTELAATDGYWMPAAVSPDESRIAFVRSTGMVVQTLATGDTVRIGAKGWFPSFSPDGQRVAYADESSAYLTVASVDGSSSTLITEASLNLAPIVWMPDGMWILGWGGGPELVNPTSKEMIPLPHLSKYSEIRLNP
jgi:Tol biopolymer transport system component